MAGLIRHQIVRFELFRSKREDCCFLHRLFSTKYCVFCTLSIWMLLVHANDILLLLFGNLLVMIVFGLRNICFVGN